MTIGFPNWLKTIAVLTLALTPLNSTAAQVERFDLASLDGSKLAVETSDTDEAKLTVLYFTGTECPLAKLYAPRVVELAEQYSSTVRFIGISSNQQDSIEEFKQFTAAYKISFPCGKDFNNVVADQLEVKRTPEVIVLDEQFNIRYRGRIDDQYSPGIARNSVNRRDLKIAIDELLSGKKVSRPSTEPEGCLLGRVKEASQSPTVTYANQVSRIFQKHCTQCHRTDEIGPFVIDDFEEAVGWGDMIVETIDNGRMPPWHADPQHGSFLNERRMSDAEKKLVRQWVEEGTPFGDAADLPEKQTFTEGWQLPKAPDVVLPMRKRAFTIPADGTVDYQFFVVDPKFEEDKWISAAEVVPGNRSVVHHSIVFIRPPDGTHLPDLGWLGAYVPGQKNIAFDPTRARFVPAGSKLVFQQHYTPTGTEQTDITKIGLVFADPEKVTDELQTYLAIDKDFEIKPNDPAHQVNASLRDFPKHGTLLSISPHMHFRGKSFVATLEAERKSETGNEVILKVPEYDFNWQHIYQFSEPVPLADIRSIKTEIVFDNSAANPFNPDPTKYVTWGDQTWEEMAIGFFDISVPRKQISDGATDATSEEAEEEKSAAESAKLDAEVSRLVAEFFERFDADNDGLIVRSELPIALQRRYSRFNTDGQRGLSKADVAEEARRRLEKRD